MPLYDYHCTKCGPFREWMPMRESSADVECPGCRIPSGRAVTAPFLADMPENNRIAHQRNEQSADQPQVMNKKQMRQTGTLRGDVHTHAHAAGQSHCHGHGSHNHQHHAGRPWMIGH